MTFYNIIVLLYSAVNDRHQVIDSPVIDASVIVATTLLPTLFKYIVSHLDVMHKRMIQNFQYYHSYISHFF